MNEFCRCKFTIAWEKWAKKKKKKKKKISASWFSLTKHISPSSGFIQNLKSLALIAGENSVPDFMRKKEKWKNEVNDKHVDAHSI